MRKNTAWQKWNGTGYPSANKKSLIYYHLGMVDVESPGVLENLIDIIEKENPELEGIDGLVEQAVVVHGEVLSIGETLYCKFGETSPGDLDIKNITREATWVEVLNG